MGGNYKDGKVVEGGVIRNCVGWDFSNELFGELGPGGNYHVTA